MFSGFNRSKTATGTRVTVDLNHDGDRTLRQRPSTSITQAVHHLRHRPAQALSRPGKRAAGRRFPSRRAVRQYLQAG
jgi:hypothetical protein